MPPKQQSSCGLNQSTVQEHTESLTWLKTTVKSMDDKIELMYKKLVTGNGEPSIPMQLRDLKHEIHDVDQYAKVHVDWHKESEVKQFKAIPIIISLLNISAVIVFGYLAFKAKG